MSSFYEARTWHAGRNRPPPIFASIGVRHPHSIEIDITLRDKETLEELLDYIASELRRMDSGNVVIALAALPKLAKGQGLECFSGHRAWPELQDRIHRSVPHLEPRGLSMVAYAVARLHWQDTDLMAAILTAAERRATDFGSTDVAKMVWTLAKLKIKDDARTLWDLMAKEAAKKCGAGRFIDISMTAWAFAKSGLAERVLFGQLASGAIEIGSELPPHTIANLAWAFAKAKIHNAQLFDVLADLAVQHVSTFDRQSLSNTVWAFATLNIMQENLFTVFADHTVNSGVWRTFSPQMASNMVWAYAKVGFTEVPLFDVFAEFLEHNAASFDNQNIANYAWAYAIAELPTKHVFDLLTQLTLGRLEVFRLDEFCGILWAYVRAGVVHAELFEEAVQLLLRRVDTLDQQSVSNLLWVMASSEHQQGSPVRGAPELMDVLLTALLDLRIRLDSEGAAMAIWAYWRVNRFHDAWTLYVRTLSDGRHPEHGKTGFTKKHAVDGRQRYFQILLMEAERRGDVAKQVYLWKQMAADFYSRALRSACLNCAIMALGRAGDLEGVHEMLRQMRRTNLANVVTEQLARRLGFDMSEIQPAEIVDITIRRRPQQQSRFEDFHYKETSVLETVLANAGHNDPRSIHAAIEEVGLKEVWLKIAGGEKACVIDNVLNRHRPKLVLEYGTYVGYTCTRMGMQVGKWAGRVISMEMDPVNATIARNVIELAGLSHVVSVQLGHSDDCMPVVLDTCGIRSVDFVFMDQRGTRFHHDLKTLERLEILTEPAVLMADNVLKPGAPFHVWRICNMPQYTTDIVDLREFGSDRVEDWMTVTWIRRCTGYGKDPQERRELVELGRESDRVRLRAMATSMKDLVGELLDEFADRFSAEFRKLGIPVTMLVQTTVNDDGEALSRLVRLAPDELPPKWAGAERREKIVGGHWFGELDTSSDALFLGEAVHR